MTVKTTDKDLGYKKLIKELKKAEGSFVTVGVHKKEGEDTYANGASVSLVGAVHEFGTDRAGPKKNTSIAERSWLRSTFDQNRDKWRKLSFDLFQKVLIGRATTKKVLDSLGLVMTEKTKAKFKTGDPSWPPLKDETLERKDTPRPLVDSWKLHNSINYETKIK